MIPKVPTNKKDLARLLEQGEGLTLEFKRSTGVTLEQLSGRHPSELRNPLIAEAFHRTGAVEVWGRGTNRVISECNAHGIPPPSFEEQQGWVVVTFRAPIAPAAPRAVGSEDSSEKRSEKV